jgi:menaquinol-cytochrome c reductase iron-sulfur subunit
MPDDDETVTRRRFMAGTANVAGAAATAAIALPALGFAIGPVFERQRVTWQSVGRPSEFSDSDYSYRTIQIAAGIGSAGLSTVYVRKRNPAIDVEPEDRWNRFLALSSRCAHVGCPVRWVAAAESFVCPCHGGVYDFRGLRTGGPPPRPLDRFYTRVRAGQVEIGPRYSVNNELRRFSPRDPGESLDGLGPYFYPRRFSTAPKPG